MDPASAIGVASAAIGFLEVTIKICKLAGEVTSSQDGATKGNAELETETNKFKQTTDKVDHSKLPQELVDVFEDSISASIDLLKLLKRIRKRKDGMRLEVWKAACVYRSVKHRGGITSLQQRLERCRRAVVEALLHETFKKSVEQLELSNASFLTLDKRGIDIFGAVKDGNEETLNLLVQGSNAQQQIDDKISGLDNTIRLANDQIGSKVDNLAQVVSDMAKSSLKEDFINSLYFSEYKKRELNVSDPCTATFEWFFDRDGGADPTCTGDAVSDLDPWQSFPRWLENPDSSQQYWLSGKAGSGKSTLMAQISRNPSRTEKYLRRWCGSRDLCTLSLFLFRAGPETQVGLAYLLRSLLYQLIKEMPALEGVLMAKFLPQKPDPKIADWPVHTLKKMLSSAIDTVDDSSLLILIDGVDEFQSYAQPGSDEATAVELLAFLHEIQKPSHVKLCVSSRPELHIAERYTSFVETRLSVLNQKDIRTFVEERLSSLPGLLDRDRLSDELCDRADGTFMWTVFALREMEEGHLAKEGHSDLMKRLNGMGESLESAIKYMLRGITISHQSQVAFYLQALSDWLACGLSSSPSSRHMSVALIAVARTDAETLSAQDVVDLCHKEERALRYFTRGLIEITVDRDDPDAHRTHLITKRSDVGREICPQSTRSNNRCGGDHMWALVPNEAHMGELYRYCKCSISFTHRSAYDFFFSEANAAEHRAAGALMKWHKADEVREKIRHGLFKLLGLLPLHAFDAVGTDHAHHKVLARVQWEKQCRVILHYTACTSPSQRERETTMDKLLSLMRPEPLPYEALESLYGDRHQVPGDIFSRITVDGRLQLIDEAGYLSPDPGLQCDDIFIAANLESEFWYECCQYSNMRSYLSDQVGNLHKRPVGRFVLAEMIKKQTLRKTLRRSVLESICRWTQQLNRHRQFLESSWLSWPTSWYACNDTLIVRSPEQTRLNRYFLRRSGRANSYFQWTPYWPVDHNGPDEAAIVKSLTAYFYGSLGYKSPSLTTLRFIMRPWDVWILISFRNDPTRTAPKSLIWEHTRNKVEPYQTRLFSSLNATCDIYLGPVSRPARPSAGTKVYKIVQLSVQECGFGKVLYSHILDPSIDITPRTGFLRFLCFHSKPLLGRVIDAIIADIACSTQLTQSQKDEMIMGVKCWPRSKRDTEPDYSMYHIDDWNSEGCGSDDHEFE